MLILLFAYMENVSYLVAIVGFASAGLAIAMKDLFMSVLRVVCDYLRWKRACG